MTPIAYARTSHGYESSISEVPSNGPGGTVPVPGVMRTASSMTIHSKDLYVAEFLEGEGTVKSRTDQFAPSISKPGGYEFVSQLPLQPELSNRRYAGIAFGEAAGEAEMYLGQHESPPGVDVFSAGLCGNLECASPQKFWTGAGAPSSFKDNLRDIAVDNSSGAEAKNDWAKGDVFAEEEFENRVIDIFTPEAGGSERYVGQVTGPSAGEPFEELRGIAVSGFNGDLVVGTTNTVYVFRPEEEGPHKGKYVLAQRLVPPNDSFNAVTDVAVDDSTEGLFRGEIYVATKTAVYEFGPEGSFRGDIKGVPKEGIPTGVEGQGEEVRFNEDTARPVSLAVDPASHRVFVGLFGSEVGPKFESLAVVDVFSPDVVVPDVETKGPFNLELETDGSGAHLWGILVTGTVNPDDAGEASCQFVWGTSKQALNQVAPCGSEVPNGGKQTLVDASLGGLTPDTTYYYRLQARNEDGINLGEESQDYEFTTPGPGLESESASAVSSSSATLEATIVPHDASDGAHDLQADTNSPTSYYFQYSTGSIVGCVADPSACMDVPLVPASTGVGVTGVEVEQGVRGLAPNTTYHYRVVASNEALPKAQPPVVPIAEPGVQIAFYGPDRTFTTQGAGKPLTLPDGRVWELVSPVNKHGAKVEQSAWAAMSGDELAFVTGTPSESSPQGYDGNGNQVLASRVTPGEWSSADISLSHSSPVGILADVLSEYRFFSKDLGLGFVESLGPFSIPEGWHQNQYGEWERIVETFPVPTERTPYLRHDSTCESNWSTCYEPLLDAEDTSGGEAHEGTANEGKANFVGATSDASHAVISSHVRLTGSPVSGSGPWLYEWSADEPEAQRLPLVSILPAGEELDGAQFDYISADGSLVFFTDANVVHKELHVRDIPTNETIRLDVTEGGTLGGGLLNFWGASTDGSKFFFTDNAGLKKNSGRTGSDLYVCEMKAGSGPLRCTLRDLTAVPEAGQPGANESAQVSRVLDVSPDGSYIYFVAKGVQAARATPGDENLYVAHEREGVWTTTLIASSSAGVSLASAASPSGRWLEFSSEVSFTGYDNRDVKTGRLDSQVYLYDALSGKFVCVSCNPTSVRPIGPAEVPLPSHVGEPRLLLNSGRLFFNSGDALVSQDTNSNADVYEFEPAGIGDCSPSSVTFNVDTGGCVSLISSGVASGKSIFLEASDTGSDVFFTTAERLVSKDVDTAVDVYDAHECSAGSPCPSVRTQQTEKCGSATTCRAAPAVQPPIYGAPSSATFAGAGNVMSEMSAPGTPKKPGPTVEKVRKERLRKALKVCKKRHGKGKRVACERKARARYAVKASRLSVRRSAATARHEKRG
ncbi:MAG: hypothetical protein WB709_02080 [Solirubrobacteraceae bacterium]